MDNVDLARLYVDEKLSANKIGKIYGLSHQIVCRRLVKLGIQRRGRGRQMSMQSNPNWQGGIWLDSDGYVNIKRPEHRLSDYKGYVKRSIINWEEANGLPFPEGKEPHHIDLDTLNDAAENISPLTHLEHALEHARIRSIRKA